MYLNPTLGRQLAQERQREMLAQASRQRLAREIRRASPVTTGTESARPRTGRLFRRARPVIGPC